MTAPLACPAHPSTDLVHLDGACRCFYGGPGPQHAASRPASEWAALRDPDGPDRPADATGRAVGGDAA